MEAGNSDRNSWSAYKGQSSIGLIDSNPSITKSKGIGSSILDSIPIIEIKLRGPFDNYFYYFF
ncbi:MAG: hypothetical protein IPH33_18390 [Bacteroidetes bacterium]|nr:hypothetical protein [Bacteroidota bacterium]